MTAGPRVLPEEPFLAFCDQITAFDVEQLVERYRLPQAEAETLVPGPARLPRAAARDLGAARSSVPEASLRDGLLLDLVRVRGRPRASRTSRRQVLASAAALGEKYRYDAPHAQKVAQLAVRLFDELRAEHGLTDRHRLLLEVAALLHDIGIYVNLRGHHKHSQYILSRVRDLRALPRRHGDGRQRGALPPAGQPQKSHLPYMALDRETRVEVNKLAAILRVANALDADHLQKVKDVRVVPEETDWVLEVDGAGDLTMERLAAIARADFMTEVFGRRLTFREAAVRAWA